MKARTLFLFPLIGALSYNCGKSSNKNEELAVKSDTTQVAEEPDEYQEHMGLPADSILVSFGKDTCRLYGKRAGDTLLVDGDMSFHYGLLKGVATTRYLWPIVNDSIAFPYTLTKVIQRDTAQSRHIKEAMAMVRAVLPVRFYPRTANDTNYVEFRRDTGVTSSSVGMRKEKQTIKLTKGRKKGTITHEILHALGLYHEHNRLNRNEFVTIDDACIKKGNYTIAFCKDRSAVNYGPYNYNSIMHYSEGTCLTAIDSTAKPGQRSRITETDIQAVRAIYKLGSTSPVKK